MQYPFGIARITYPRTVALSDADPATAVPLPARVQRIPAVVSRPVRIGDDNVYRSTSEALLKSAQILHVMDPATPAPGMYPTSVGYNTGSGWPWSPWSYLSGGGSYAYGTPYGTGSLLDSGWLLPILGGGVVLVVLAVLAGRR